MLHCGLVQFASQDTQPPVNPYRSVLVTGGSGVIGSAIVEALSSDGFAVYSSWLNNEKRAYSLGERTGCETVRCDIACESEVDKMFRDVPNLWAVVHAAGISRDTLLLRQSAEMWKETVAVNATGAFLVTRAALNALPSGGRLILLASRAGVNGAVGQGAYAASKAATIALAKVAAREGSDRRIAVNALCPGVVESSLTAPLGPKAMSSLRMRSVFDELGLTDHVVGAVRWLLSEAAAGVSGQVIHCDSRI